MRFAKSFLPTETASTTITFTGCPREIIEGYCVCRWFLLDRLGQSGRHLKDSYWRSPWSHIARLRRDCSAITFVTSVKSVNRMATTWQSEPAEPRPPRSGFFGPPDCYALDNG